jgi:hypothetical protein
VPCLENLNEIQAGLLEMEMSFAFGNRWRRHGIDLQFSSRWGLLLTAEMNVSETVEYCSRMIALRLINE